MLHLLLAKDEFVIEIGCLAEPIGGKLMFHDCFTALNPLSSVYRCSGLLGRKHANTDGIVVRVGSEWRVDF